MNDINLFEMLEMFGISYYDYKRRFIKTMEYKSFIAFTLSYTFGFGDEEVGEIMELDRTTVLHHRNKTLEMIMMYEKTGGYKEQMNRLESIQKVLRKYIDFKKELPDKLVDFRRHLLDIVEKASSIYLAKFIESNEIEINNFISTIKKEIETYDL
jgi:hypothetical protein